jgi:hypothetical protein|uniref:Uncharacterized protein n=1 Tax=Panagrolaimus sp. PS1159 TaxID=55785 RepID=A0AC35GIX3_9BILA
MQLFLIPNEQGLEELTLIELQGTFEINDDISGMEFGEIQWINGKPFMKIVNNLYEGKFVDLEKPLLLLNKKTAKKLDAHHKCEIEAIVERKLLFNIRPRPIIDTTTSSTTAISKSVFGK